MSELTSSTLLLMLVCGSANSISIIIDVDVDAVSVVAVSDRFKGNKFILLLAVVSEFAGILV